MSVDTILRGGRVIDPAAGIDEIRDIHIRGGRIVEPDGSPVREIDASGCIVTPGLIDYHAHVFQPGSALSIPPDELLRQGTTTVVDAGSAGCDNYGDFDRNVMKSSGIRILSFLNVSSCGLADTENYDPVVTDVEGIALMIVKHHDQIQGLKIRLSKGIVPAEHAAAWLHACVALADTLQARLDKNLRVCVHTTDSPIPAAEIAGLLRPGDIFCHCYQGVGNTILTEKGEIDPGILEARARGVLFDAANGKSNFCLETAKKALAAGFLPDLISSDLTTFSYPEPSHVGSLPHVLSKYLELGLGLQEVLRLCTAAPARLLGLEGEIGTLRPGARADIALFRLENRVWEQRDWRGAAIECHQLLVPQLTIKDGAVSYCIP